MGKEGKCLDIIGDTGENTTEGGGEVPSDQLVEQDGEQQGLVEKWLVQLALVCSSLGLRWLHTC